MTSSKTQITLRNIDDHLIDYKIYAHRNFDTSDNAQNGPTEPH